MNWAQCGEQRWEQSGEQSRQDDHAPMMAEMNLTPLIDVLLVLVVMLLVTMCPTRHSVNLNLCQDRAGLLAEPCRYIGPEKHPRRPAPGDILSIGIDSDGSLSLNRVAVNRAALDAALIAAGNWQHESQPEVYVNPSPLAQYKYVMAVLAMAQRDGVVKLSLPPGRGAFRKPVPQHTGFRIIDWPFGRYHHTWDTSWFDSIVWNILHDGSEDDGLPRGEIVVFAVACLLTVLGAVSYLIFMVQTISCWGLRRDHLFRQMAESARAAGASHGLGSLSLHVSRDRWLAAAMARSQVAIRRRMQFGMVMLASIASTAPFIGLFGTVWGIYCLLTTTWTYAPNEITRLMGPIGEALFTTGLGLAVAVPALIGFNLLTNRQARGMAEVKAFSTEMRMQMLAQGR